MTCFGCISAKKSNLKSYELFTWLLSALSVTLEILSWHDNDALFRFGLDIGDVENIDESHKLWLLDKMSVFIHEPNQLNKAFYT